MRVVLTGGGTGGHVYPALALAEALAADASFAPLDLRFVGTRDRLEAEIVPKAGWPIAYVRAAPLVRRGARAFAATLALNARGFVDALGIFHRARPDALIATGGYVTFPVVAALRFVRLLGRTRARIALLEPNAVTGLTNRLLGPLVDEVWYASAPQHRALRRNECVVGTPVRASMRRPMDAAAARRALGVDVRATTIVVMGGSLGARRINDAVAGLALAGLPAGWHVVVLAGARDFIGLAQRLASCARVTVLSYLDDPRAAYAAADVVVARAGASTLAELAATATPAILVPYPFATDDHQSQNARAYARTGAATIVADGDLDAARLRAELDRALAPGALSSARDRARDRAANDPAAAILERVKRWPRANGNVP